MNLIKYIIERTKYMNNICYWIVFQKFSHVAILKMQFLIKLRWIETIHCNFLIFIFFRFRECLKNSTTPTCDLVGRIFFSYLGMKCFTLQPESVCVKRSWWGGCQRYSSQHKARVQSPSTFWSSVRIQEIYLKVNGSNWFSRIICKQSEWHSP